MVKRPFIRRPLRPDYAPDAEPNPPLQTTPAEETAPRAREALGETDPVVDSGAVLAGTRYSRSPDVHWTAMDGEIVLVNLTNSMYYTLSRVGAAIWDGIDGTRTVTDLLGLLTDRFDVEKAAATRDLQAILADLEKEGLIRTT